MEMVSKGITPPNVRVGPVTEAQGAVPEIVDISNRILKQRAVNCSGNPFPTDRHQIRAVLHRTGVGVVGGCATGMNSLQSIGVCSCGVQGVENASIKGCKRCVRPRPCARQDSFTVSQFHQMRVTKGRQSILTNIRHNSDIFNEAACSHFTCIKVCNLRYPRIDKTCYIKD